PYAAVAGGHDRLSGELRALFRWYVLVDGLLRRFLSGPAQAGTYGQAAPFDGLRTFFGRVTQHVRLGQLAHHVVAVERKLGLGTAAGTRCVVDTKILALVLVRLRTVEVPGGDHAVEDQVTALHRDFGVREGAVVGRAAHEPGQQCRLAGVEFGGARGEVAFGGDLDAVRPRAEVGEVEVALQDLVLGHPVFQLDRVTQFDEFAVQGRGTGPFDLFLGLGVLDEQVLHVLLGEGGTALGASLNRPQGRSQEATQVQSAVLVETFVLDRHERCGGPRADLVEVDDLTFALGDLTEGFVGAVGEHDPFGEAGHFQVVGHGHERGGGVPSDQPEAAHPRQ